MGTKIVVGLDGSEGAERAAAWAAGYALAVGAEVVVVHAMSIPAYSAVGFPYAIVPDPTPEQLESRRDVVTRDWCKPLADAGVAFRVQMMGGDAPSSLMEVADSEDAALVVTGRRGLGGFKEFLLGSTSHHLSHHLDRPLVIVP